MIAFWISAALVSAAAAALVVHRAARAVRIDGAGDPALAVYRRQLAEIDDLAERGLLIEDERRSAHAEAARRLLAAAEDKAAPVRGSTRAGRLAVMAVAALAPVAAIGVYLAVGSPQAPDQPFARRLAAWRAADPASLAPEQLAAVLQLIVQARPNDPQAYFFLSRVQLAAGDPFSALQNLQAALTLAPRRADLWTALGETYMAQAEGEITGDALSAFRRAAEVDPAAPAPRYYLARARIAGGDLAGGLADWRALDQSLAPADARRKGLEQEIAEVDRTHALPRAEAQDPGEAQATAPQAGAGQQAFIRTMVATLAARLNAHPDDPAGWARLIRAYAVLGDQPARAAAQARAEALFKQRPDDLRLVEQAATGPQR